MRSVTLAPGERAAPAEPALGGPAQAGKAERRHDADDAAHGTAVTHRAMCNVCYIYIEEMKNVTALVTEISSRLQIYPLQVFVRCFAWRARRRALATLAEDSAHHGRVKASRKEGRARGGVAAHGGEHLRPGRRISAGVHPSCYRFPQAPAGMIVVCPRPAGDAEGREHPARMGGLSWQAGIVGCDPTHQPIPRGRPHVLGVLSDVRVECDLHWQGHSRRRWGCRGRQGKESPQEGT